MVDTWTEVADARRILVSSGSPLRSTKPGEVLILLLRLLTALFVGLSAYNWDSENLQLLMGLAVFFGLPLLVVETWQNKYEIRPREVFQRSGPFGLFTQQSVPLSAFRSVVCDYDRRMVDVSERDDDGDQVGPTILAAKNSFRVTLEGKHHVFRLASFDDSPMARMLAMSIASRFALELVDLQALPSDEEVRAAERLMSDQRLRPG